MLMTPGPKRIILIRSGQYDYAEVLLGQSAHLVGRNNAGKTSLISTLQFLYIASFNEMRFSGHPWEESLRYYFKEDTSYIIFECVSADGRFVTMGLRGGGQISGYKVERFAFSGPYQRDDFISEDQRVRKFDEVKERLVSTRFFKSMEPKDIRAAIVGDSDVPEVSLGIVPLKDTGRYDDFAYLFKNLLRLNNMGQNEIKETLLTVYRRELRHSIEVDLSREYDDLVSGLAAEKEKLSGLRRIAPIASKLKSERIKRDRAKRDLPALYLAVETAKATSAKDLAVKAMEFEDQLRKLSGLKVAAEERQQALIIEGQQNASKHGVVGNWLIELDADEGKFLTYLPELQDQAIANMQIEANAIAGRIHASTSSPEVVEAEVDKIQKKLSLATIQRDNYALLVGTKLRKMMDADGIADVFHLLNPSILRLAVGSDGVDIQDAKVLQRALDDIRSHIHDGTFDGAGVSMRVKQRAKLSRFPG